MRKVLLAGLLALSLAGCASGPSPREVPAYAGLYARDALCRARGREFVWQGTWRCQEKHWTERRDKGGKR